MNKKLMSGLPPIAAGIAALVYVISNPRFATYKGSDVVTLVAGGALLAVGLGMIFGRVKLPE